MVRACISFTLADRNLGAADMRSVFWQSCLKQLERAGAAEFSIGLTPRFRGLLSLGEIHGSLSKQGNVSGHVVGRDVGLVPVESKVKTLMQLTLDRPLITDHCRECRSVQFSLASHRVIRDGGSSRIQLLKNFHITNNVVRLLSGRNIS